jgi:serine/threonine protein phosphatase PrpC
MLILKILFKNYSFSGSTCVSVLFDRNTIFCANAGDSRAVLYSYDKA